MREQAPSPKSFAFFRDVIRFYDGVILSLEAFTYITELKLPAQLNNFYMRLGLPGVKCLSAESNTLGARSSHFLGSIGVVSGYLFA